MPTDGRVDDVARRRCRAVPSSGCVTGLGSLALVVGAGRARLAARPARHRQRLAGRRHRRRPVAARVGRAPRPPATSPSRSCRCSAWRCSCVVARFGAREAMVDVSTDGEHWRGLLPRPLAAALGGWWVGYAVAVAAGGRPHHRRTVPGRGAVARRPHRSSCRSLALALALRPVALDDPDVLGPRLGAGAGARHGAPSGCVPGSSVPAMLLGLGLLLVARGGRARLAPRHDDLRRGRRRPGSGRRCSSLAQVALARQPRHVGRVVPGRPGFRVVEGGAVTLVRVRRRPAADGARARGAAAARASSRGSPPCRCSSSSPWAPSSPAARSREVARLSRAAHQARRRRRRLRHDRPGRRRSSTSSPAARSGQFRLSAVGAPAGSLVLALFLELVARGPRRGAPRRVAAAPVSAPPAPLGLVVLVSGSGSNLQALIDASAEPDAGRSGSSPSGPTATAPAAPSGPRRAASRRSSPGCPTT